MVYNYNAKGDRLTSRRKIMKGNGKIESSVEENCPYTIRNAKLKSKCNDCFPLRIP